MAAASGSLEIRMRCLQLERRGHSRPSVSHSRNNAQTLSPMSVARPRAPDHSSLDCGISHELTSSRIPLSRNGQQYIGSLCH